ncbi:hypothetical protein BYT27DRAFT_7094707, partial [Phlegmacium glaucopus]
VTFKPGDLVQIYRSDLDFTVSTDRKLVPRFSAPQRITDQNLHSYRLETLEGFPIAGRFSSQRLRLFVPWKGTELEEVQRVIDGDWHRQEEVGGVREGDNGREFKGDVGEGTNPEAWVDVGGNSTVILGGDKGESQKIRLMSPSVTKEDHITLLSHRLRSAVKPVRVNTTRTLLNKWVGTCGSANRHLKIMDYRLDIRLETGLD